jgi:hypothetical protein
VNKINLIVGSPQRQSVRAVPQQCRRERFRADIRDGQRADLGKRVDVASLDRNIKIFFHRVENSAGRRIGNKGGGIHTGTRAEQRARCRVNDMPERVEYQIVLEF